VQTLPAETDSPLLWLGRKLKGLASKRPSVAVQIYGEAGIGKTRAVTELLRTTPFASVSKRAVASIPELIGSLPKPKKLSSWLSSQLERLENNLQAAPIVAAYLEQLAPFVLHIEDVHECDQPRVAIWQALVLSLKNSKGVGLLLTSRVKLEVSIESIHLKPLNLEASTALLENEIDAALPKDAIAWIYARAAGNPLFTLEYFKHLARLGSLWNDTKRWHWREPPGDTTPLTVEALIEQLLFDSSGTPESRMVLQAIALLETRVPQLPTDATLLLAITTLTPLALKTAELHLQRQGILSANSFAHPLFRELTFKQLPVQQREVFARRSLQALQEDHPEFAAELLTDCNFANETAHTTLLACAQAMTDQPTRAAHLKARAAHYLTGLTRANLLLEALEVLIHSEPSQALLMAQAILEIPGLPNDTRASAVFHATFAIVTTTRNLAAAQESLNRLPPSHQNDTRHLGALLGYMMLCGQPARALEMWEAHPELQISADVPILIHVLSGLMQTAQFARAEDLSQHMLTRPNLTSREQMNVLNIRAITLAHLGQLEESERVGLEAIALAKRLELHNALGVMLFNRAVTLERGGQRDAMREVASQALLSLEKAGNLGLAAQAQLILANNDLETGRYEACEEHLNNAYAALRQGTITPFLVHVQLALVRFHLQRRAQYAQTLALKYARDALENAQALGQEKLIAMTQTHLSVALVSVSQPVEASQFLNLALPILQDAPDTNSFYVLHAKARLLEAQSQPALEVWQYAEARAIELGFLFDAQRYRLEIARLERDLEQAQSLKAWFESTGLMHGVNLVRHYFPELEINQLATSDMALRLEVLGAMQISKHGVSNAVKGQKRKELLAVLLEARVAGRHEVKSLELLDALYPNAIEQDGLAALKQTVFKTRAAHGSNIITTTTNGYALGSVSSDAEEFLQHGDTKLWRGAFLDGLSTCDEVRETLTQRCQHQAQKILETEPKEAARVMRLLLESDPYNLETLKLTCQALRLDNNHRTLQRVYNESQAKLLEVGELIPETWQQFLG
jgi:hypothetical protein